MSCDFKSGKIVIRMMLLNAVDLKEISQFFRICISQSNTEDVLFKLFANIKHFSVQNLPGIIDKSYSVTQFFYTFHAVSGENNGSSVFLQVQNLIFYQIGINRIKT